MTYNEGDPGAVTRTVEAKLQEVVSVKDFGAIGNGVVDDTDAITDAINAVGNAGGGTVLFPAGTYLVSEIVCDWAGIVLQGEDGNAYDFTTPQGLGTTINCVSGVFALYMKYTLGAAGTAHSGEGMQVKGISFTGTTEYGILCSTFATLLEDVTVSGFQYGFTAIGQNSNKYNRCTFNNNTKAGFVILDAASVAFTAPNWDLSTTEIVASTIYTVTNCIIRNNQFGIVLREGVGDVFNSCTIESNYQAGLLIYVPIGNSINRLVFNSVWFENNYAGYTSGSTAYSITGYNALKSSSTEYLKGDGSGQWTSASDAGFSVWLGAYDETTSDGPGDIKFSYGQIGCNSVQQKSLRIRSGSRILFDTVSLSGGDPTLGLSTTAYASYTLFQSSDAQIGTNITAINNGTVGGNRPAVIKQDFNNSGGWDMIQGAWRGIHDVPKSLLLSGIETSVTAHAGGGLASATVLNPAKLVHIVTTVASSGDSVLLPIPIGSGAFQFVKNLGANTMNVYATGGAYIDNQPINGYVTIASNSARIFIDAVDGQWISLAGA